MSGNLDERLLGHWQESSRRQESMRRYLAKSSLPLRSFDPKVLDMLAEAFSTAPVPLHGDSPVPRAASLLSDDR